MRTMKKRPSVRLLAVVVVLAVVAVAVALVLVLVVPAQIGLLV